MNILVAPNSFKECTDSVEISKIIQSNISGNNHNLFINPLSDGGDGFLKTYKFNNQTKALTYLIKNSYDNTLNKYKVVYDDKNKRILVESAELFGLKIIPRSKLNPLLLNSEILGTLLKLLNQDVQNEKIEVDEVLIGIGGTATIDMGIGACSEIGFNFYNENGEMLEAIPRNFINAKKYVFRETRLDFKVKCIVDVDTKLIDYPGAIEIYGKQKGATNSDLKIIKDGIINILDLIKKNNPSLNIEDLNGAGGGLATGLNLFLDAEIIQAKDFINDYLLKNVKIDSIDAVITGEGNFDFQSFEGKGVGVILDIFRSKSIPIFIICGNSNLPEHISLPSNIKIIRLIDFFETKDEAMRNYKLGIEKAVEIIKNQLKN